LLALVTVASSAVSELLRFDGPVQATVREALEDVHIGGKTIVQGQRVTVLLGSAMKVTFLIPTHSIFAVPARGCFLAAMGCTRAWERGSPGELARRFPNPSESADGRDSKLCNVKSNFQWLRFQLRNRGRAIPSGLSA
jgi:hypothetical protein